MTEIVILGGGMVAGFAAREMVEEGLEDHHPTIVSAVSADTEPPYHRPPLSKGFLAGEEEAEVARFRPASGDAGGDRLGPVEPSGGERLAAAEE